MKDIDLRTRVCCICEESVKLKGCFRIWKVEKKNEKLWKVICPTCLEMIRKPITKKEQKSRREK